VRKDLTTVRDELQELSTGTGKYEMSPSQHHMHHASFERRVIRGGGDHQVHEVINAHTLYVHMYLCLCSTHIGETSFNSHDSAHSAQAKSQIVCLVLLPEHYAFIRRQVARQLHSSKLYKTAVHAARVRLQQQRCARLHIIS
jgi:hypothetical protein